MQQRKYLTNPRRKFLIGMRLLRKRERNSETPDIRYKGDSMNDRENTFFENMVDALE